MIKPFHHDASSGVFEAAKKLRKNMTPAEKRLWKILRDRRFEGHKFRRQHPIGIYVADFYCAQSKLIIEVDGEIHNSVESQRYDAERTDFLESLGLKVIRFTNNEVLRNEYIVFDKISNFIISGSFLTSGEKGRG